MSPCANRRAPIATSPASPRSCWDGPPRRFWRMRANSDAMHAYRTLLRAARPDRSGTPPARSSRRSTWCARFPTFERQASDGRCRHSTMRPPAANRKALRPAEALREAMPLPGDRQMRARLPLSHVPRHERRPMNSAVRLTSRPRIWALRKKNVHSFYGTERPLVKSAPNSGNYLPGRSSRLSSPAATLRPTCPCTLSGCSAIEFADPPTSALPPIPTPTDALPCAPA